MFFLAGFLHCTLETHWLGGSFLMVYRNNAGMLGFDFISVCLETCWLGQKSGYYVPEYCKTLRQNSPKTRTQTRLFMKQNAPQARLFHGKKLIKQNGPQTRFC